MRLTIRSTRSGKCAVTDPAISAISGASTARVRRVGSAPGVLIVESASGWPRSLLTRTRRTSLDARGLAASGDNGRATTRVTVRPHGRLSTPLEHRAHRYPSIQRLWRLTSLEPGRGLGLAFGATRHDGVQAQSSGPAMSRPPRRASSGAGPPNLSSWAGVPRCRLSVRWRPDVTG